MKKINLIFLVVIILFIGSCCKEGTDGKATLIVTLKHHDDVIPNQANYPDTVFVKFNTNQLPGTEAADFDTYFVGEAGEDHVHIHGLKCGSYYLYAVGMDSAGPYRVMGGVPFRIEYKNRKDEMTVDVPVKE